jgi:hypothetical protein
MGKESELQSESIQFGAIVLHTTNTDACDLFATYDLERVYEGEGGEFCGYGLSIETMDDLAFIGFDSESIIEAIKDCQTELTKHNITLNVAGLDENFSDTGFMRNSGIGYLKDLNSIVTVMYQKAI